MLVNKPTLLTLLIARQQELHLPDGAFAQRVSLSRVHWNMTRSGKRAVSLQLLQGVTRAFPDLDSHVLAFLRGEEHE